jgi:hypothetical protein
MDEKIPIHGHSRLDGLTYTNLHSYKVEIFYVALTRFVLRWTIAFVMLQWRY